LAIERPVGRAVQHAEVTSVAIPGELIPLMGLGIGAIAVTGRVIVQPLIAAFLKVHEQRQVPPAANPQLEQRLSALDERFSRLESSLDRLVEERDFYLQLQAGRPRSESPPGPGPG
jgi:hypothetical protein